ncbi:MAG: YdcH family protein [Hyphomicrobiaceae bacterium]
MSIGAHLAELSERHKTLERKLEEVMARPSADDLEIAELKREKLKIKDQIERLKSKTRH